MQKKLQSHRDRRGGGSTQAPREQQHDDDHDHDKFETTFAAAAFVRMALERNYSLTQTVRLAPAFGVEDPALVTGLYKHLLASGSAAAASKGSAAKEEEQRIVTLTAAQGAFVAELEACGAALEKSVAALRSDIDSAALPRIDHIPAPLSERIAANRDPILGRGVAAARSFAAGEVVFTEDAVAFGNTSALNSGAGFLAAARRGAFETGPRVSPRAALALLLQLHGGPLDQQQQQCLRGVEAAAVDRAAGVPEPVPEPAGESAAAAAEALPPPNSPAPTAPVAADPAAPDAAAAPAPSASPSLEETLTAVFRDSAFPGCAFLPRPASSASSAAAASSPAQRPDARRLTAAFVVTSLLNHSCAPNARFSARFDAASRSVVARVSAERAVSSGEALTIAYCDTLLPAAERQQSLQQLYGFRCACSRCSAPTDDVVVFRCPKNCAGGGVVPGNGTACVSDTGAAAAAAAAAPVSRGGEGTAPSAPPPTCGAPVPPAKMATLFSMRAKLLASFNKEYRAARMTGRPAEMLKTLATMRRVMADHDGGVFGALTTALEVAVACPAQHVDATELCGLLAASEHSLGRVAHLLSPLAVAATQEELAMTHARVGVLAQGGPAAPLLPRASAEAAARLFLLAADGLDASDGGSKHNPHAELLRALAASPPATAEAVGLATQARVETALRLQGWLEPEGEAEGGPVLGAGGAGEGKREAAAAGAGAAVATASTGGSELR